MSTGNDYIPNGHVKFHEWQENLVKQVNNNAAAWQIAPPLVTELNDERNVYVPFFNAIVNKNTRSRQQVVAHVMAKKDYESFLRSFVRANLIGNTNIPVGSKLALGLKPRLQQRKSRPAITTAPEVELKALGGYRLLIVCRTEGDVTRASVHPDANGVELRYKIGKPLPLNFKETNEFLFSTKARITLPEMPEHEGETISIFARWKNLTDDTRSGPWCNIHSVVIR